MASTLPVDHRLCVGQPDAWELAGQLEQAVASGRLVWAIVRPVYDLDRQLTAATLQVAQLD
jgi:hypothetical protein